MISPVECFRRALAAIRHNPSVIVLAALLASLPNLLTQAVSVLALNKMMPGLQDLMSMTETQLAALSQEELANMTAPPAAETAWTYILFGLTVLTSFLTLGYLRALLKELRGEDAVLADLLSRARLWLKAIGQVIWRGLWTLIWTLPGLAVTVILALVALQTNSLVLTTAIPLVGTPLMIAGFFWATMRYTLAPWVLTDRPDCGVREAQRESIRIATENRSACIRILLLMLGLSMAGNVLTLPFPGVIGSTLSMLVSLVISVFIDASFGACYLLSRGEAAPQKEPLRDGDDTIV